MPEFYDIINDEMREAKEEDWEVLWAVHKAYGQVRFAKRVAMDLDEFQTELDEIHDELSQKVAELKKGEAPELKAKPHEPA